MLLLGTVFWGASFTWSKSAGETINELRSLGAGSLVGPSLLLAVRFLASALLLVVIVPASRRGWSWASARRGAWLGLWVGLGMTLQSLGLDRTTPAVAAFLTGLTVLFVPLMMTVITRKPPLTLVLVGVVLATVGVWMLTGATPQGFGVGEVLSVACAVAFSVYIIAVNLILPREDPWRMLVAQFLVAGVVCLLTTALTPGGRQTLAPSTLAPLLAHPDVLGRAVLLTIFPTLAGYALLTVYQPRVDPTRAALIYLMEPIFAAAYAYAATGSALTPLAMGGAALILVANIVVEALANHRRNTE